jgi:hypothetical protein
MQTRRMSAIEAAANVAVGYGVAVLATAIVLPAFGYQVTAQHALGISAVFTVVSLARSYALRRVFNRIR